MRLSQQQQASESADHGRLEPLSAHMKHATAAAHRDVERLMDLPARLQTIQTYAACLQRFARILAPIEKSFAHFNQWEAFGIDIANRMRLPALLSDLAALGVPPPAAKDHPNLFNSFPHAIGGLYVTEGATLGGQHIARAAAAALGSAAIGKTAFFSGHGPQTGPMWNRLRAAIDGFGDAHPHHRDAVTEGAHRAFAHFADTLQAHPP